MTRNREIVESVSCVVAKVTQLRPLLDQYAAACELEGRIAAPVLEALKAQGLFGVTTAKRSGGEGAPIRAHVKAVAEIAKSCPGTAWAYGILAAATGTAASFPEIQRRAIFRRGDELVCFIGAKTGLAIPEQDGFLVTGEWRYGSGCLHADWAMCGVKIPAVGGGEERTGTVVIDLSDSAHVNIVIDWQVCGLAGSGSNQVKAQNHFVPSHLLVPDFVGEAPLPAAGADAREARDYWPSEVQFPLTVLPSMLGAAEGLLAAVTSKMNSRPVLSWKYSRQSESQALLSLLGEAAIKIDSAWMHVLRVCDLMDEIAPTRPVTQMEKVSAQAQCGYAMRLVREAANSLMDIAGSGAFASANVMQRLWRDINLGTRHNALNSGFSLELLGRAMTGQESNSEVIRQYP
jgi:alkylation response protein AidB-like acyl-CoA dehydrogenase